MAPKRATFFTYGNDERCSETQKFIQNAGIILNVRDLSKNPISFDELDYLIGYVDIRHFLNEMSEAYDKNKLGETMPDREAVLKLMVDDQTLIRLPIIKTSRLTTVGCDKKKISEMLLIDHSGKVAEVLPSRNAKNALRAPRHESSQTSR